MFPCVNLIRTVCVRNTISRRPLAFHRVPILLVSRPIACSRKRKHCHQQYPLSYGSGPKPRTVAGPISSASLVRNYKLTRKPETDGNTRNLKQDAIDMFTAVAKAVCPRVMVESALRYNDDTSELTVQDRVYHLNKNVYVVGFGKAVLGLARVVEEILASHVVSGIISIPEGLQAAARDAGLGDILLSHDTKLWVYEGASNDEVDERSHCAAKAMENMVSKLQGTDVLVVLCSEGGSVLCPSPRHPITLDELGQVTKLLTRSGARIYEVNTVRKNLEVLKGGGLALLAKPAKVIALILSARAADPADLIACGPTYPTQLNPHHGVEILKRLQIWDEAPQSIRKYLENMCKILENQAAQHSSEKMAQLDALRKDVQNVIMDSNLVAREAAANLAVELGYIPPVLITYLITEPKIIGSLYAMLAKFITICFNRKALVQSSLELAVLETHLVAGGIKKQWLNLISKSVDKAYNMNKDICLISGAEALVDGEGLRTDSLGVSSALAALIKMQELRAAEPLLFFISCNSDGNEGLNKLVGAVANQELLDSYTEQKLDIRKYLDDNDSQTFFNEDHNLVCTKLTGTSLMDMVILLVPKPKEALVCVKLNPGQAKDFLN